MDTLPDAPPDTASAPDAGTDADEAPAMAPGAMRDALIHGSPYIVFVVLTTLATYAPDEWTQWIDPFRTFLTGGLLALLIMRGTYPELRQRKRDAPKAFWITVAAGVFVGLFWVPLAQATPGLSEEARTGFDPELVGAPWATPLLISRLLGMIVVVPLAEELFVRSLLPRFWDVYQDGGDWKAIGIGIFTPMSFMVSVGFFAFTHPEWMAALATGLIWTVLIMYTRDLWDAIVAHAIANAMLAIYIVTMGAYELW